MERVRRAASMDAPTPATQGGEEVNYFYDYNTWDEFVRCELGAWIHCHDNYIVADDPDTDACVGEWDSVKEEGWVYL